jgi:hypothetical protein
MKNFITISLIGLVLLSCYIKRYNSWDYFEYIGAYECDNTKYALIKLIDPNNTKLITKKTDTLTVNGRPYQNVYIAPQSSIWGMNTSINKYSLASDPEYGNLQKCIEVSHLTFLKKVAGPTLVKR